MITILIKDLLHLNARAGVKGIADIAVKTVNTVQTVNVQNALKDRGITNGIFRQSC